MKSEIGSLRCAGVQRFIDTYLDGEFGDADRVEFEAHLAGCTGCRQRVRVQADWKLAVKGAAPREQAPAELRNRIKRQLAREQPPLQSWRRWSVRVLPAAAAAGLIATFAFSKVQFSPVAADVISVHQRDLPIEVSGNTQRVKDWYEGKVDFPVRPPSFGKLRTVALRGGRLSNVEDHQAAYLVYDFNGNKVSVFIFDPSNMPIEAPKKKLIDNREVYFDQERGYNVALYRDHGMGYAIASDLDPDQMVTLVKAAFSP